MKKDITLVILAAGMGSRFGGLKQIEPMGPNKEFIIDYSIYDAIKAGFNKVVFLIKEENYEIFKETIGARVEPHIKVEYAFQEMDNIPEGVIIPEGREKPDSDVKRVVDILLRNDVSEFVDNKTHVNNVYAYRAEIDNKIASGICPKCGGTLVERTGRYGSFYGCSNYPKCRFTVH